MPSLFFYVGMHTGLDLKALDDVVLHFRGNAFAETTKKTYQTYLKSYLDFCKQYKLKVIPISSEDLGRYIAFLAQHLKFSSITNYLTIIKLLHLEGGFPDPISSHYIETILKGVKRVIGDSTEKKLPITPHILRGIFSTLNLGDSLDLCFWCACLVAFFSFLRKSNLLIPSSHEYDPDRHLSRHDILFHKGGAVICVNKTKTIQFAQRKLTIPLPHIKNSPLCPANSLLLLTRLVPSGHRPSPAFLYKRKNLTIPLTYQAFLRKL